jgi:hypothetical protein
VRAGQWAVFAALLLVIVVAGGSTAVAAPAAADTSKAAVHDLRGTVEPLRNEVSPARRAARALLFVPYAAYRVATWPVSGLTYLQDRHRLAQRLGSLLTLSSGPYHTSVGPLFDYESSLGVAAVGLNVRNRDWWGSGLDLKLGLGYVNDQRFLLAAGLAQEDGSVIWEFDCRREQMEERPFYGLGPRSPDRETEYDAALRLAELTLAPNHEGRLRPELVLYARDLRLHPGREEPSVAVAFPDLFATARRVQYAGCEASLAYDTRNLRDYSTRGGLVRLRGGWNESRLNGDADYKHYSAELQHFFDLYGGSRVLALRAFAEGVEPVGAGELPLTELARLGGKTGLRGYGRFRFADRRSLVLTVAYRYPVTARVQGELFVDWGSVAPTWDRLSLGDIDPSVGLGLMYSCRGDPLFTLQVAVGPEDVQVTVGTASIFKIRSRRKP